MDKCEQLVLNSQYCAAVIGDVKTGHFEWLDLFDGKPLTKEYMRGLPERGLYYIGTIGLVQGEPQCCLEETLEPLAISALTAAFVARIGNDLTSLEEALMRESASWLRKLYNLPDNRHEVN